MPPKTIWDSVAAATGEMPDAVKVKVNALDERSLGILLGIVGCISTAQVEGLPDAMLEWLHGCLVSAYVAITSRQTN